MDINKALKYRPTIEQAIREAMRHDVIDCYVVADKLLVEGIPAIDRDGNQVADNLYLKIDAQGRVSGRALLEWLGY